MSKETTRITIRFGADVSKEEEEEFIADLQAFVESQGHKLTILGPIDEA